MAKTDIWVLGTEKPGPAGRRFGGIVGVHEHRPNGWYGEDMKAPLFLRVIVSDRSPEELKRLNKFHLDDPEMRIKVRHPYVLNIPSLPAVLHEQLVRGGVAEAPWNTWKKYFEKKITIDLD